MKSSIIKFAIGEEYRSTCWFTGGQTFYVCVKRTENTVTFAPTHYEIDGTHQGKHETFPLQVDRNIEYVVVQTYRGEENRMYAAIGSDC